MKRLLLLLAVCTACISGVWAQTQTVYGKVVEASTGEPIVGASVVVQGTSTGSITSVDGDFTLDCAEGAKLEISFIGMESQVVAAKDGMLVKLSESTSHLDEVMVVAYGTTTRAQFVGSAKAVNSEELTQQASANVTNALQGKVAGVQVVNNSGQPGTAATIRVRGVGSLSGSTTPLYVVDGAPVDVDNINLISSYDIESMTVLKDASATAIYGASGANGVVLITTKSGKSHSKMNVNVDAKWGNSQRGVPNYATINDAGTHYELAYTALYNSQYYNGQSIASSYAYADQTLLTQTGVGYQVYTVPAGEKLIGTNFRLNPNATLGYSDGEYYYTPDNWENEVMNTQNLRQEYNVSISGGNTTTNYFVSAGYLNDPGLINGSAFERFTSRVKVDSQVKDWLKVGASATYSHANMNNPSNMDDWGSTGNVFYAANAMAPIFPFYVRDAEGNIKVDGNGYQVYDTGTNTNAVRPGSAPQGNNAINLLIDTNDEVSDYFTGSLYVAITPIEGLSISANITPEYMGRYSNSLSNPFYGSTSVGGAVGVASERFFSINQQYTIGYKTKFADFHNIEVIAGWEAYDLKEQVLSASNDHLFNPFVAELGNAYGVAPTSANATSYTHNYSTAGAFARLQYDLMNRYFLTGTFRYDASSRFAKENRWGAFGSVGAAWLINRESWMSDVKWVNELKLKASWGTQGNDRLGNYYVHRNLYSISYNSETGEYSKVLSQLGNPNLKWESQVMSNVGVDFGLLDNRLNGSIEYFNRQNADMLFYVSMPPSSGYGSLSMPMNVGKVQNQGLEFDLEAVLVSTKNIEWSVYGNITYVDGKVLRLPDSYLKEDGTRSYIGSSYILKEGGSLSQAYLPEYAGVDPETGKAMYYLDPADHSKGTTTTYSDDLAGDLGDISVKCYGGFGTNLSLYGVDLGVQFAYQFGGMGYDGTYQEMMHAGDQLGHIWHVDILNAWTPENTDTNVPRICSSDSYNQQTSSRWLVSSNYLSLNNVTVGYTLPNKWTSKIGVAKARVFFQGDNLALFSARQGYDPRQSQNALSYGVGISTNTGNFVYSLTRIFSGGISISF